MLAFAPLAAVTLALALLSSTADAKAKAKAKCAPGFYSHSSQAGCFPCGAQALTCTSKTGALTCKTGYIVSKGLCIAKPKTTKPAPKPTKDTCPAGQYYHSQSQGCYNCGPHAVTCHSKGLAITCAKGYTLQDGDCVAANTVRVTGSAKTVTVTGGFAQRVTSVVTATSVAAPVTVTARTASTTIEAGAQVTATSTDIATLTASETTTSTISTSTITNWYTPSTTSTSTNYIATTTTWPAASPIATMVRYAGCVNDNDFQLLITGISAIAIAAPLTASTAITACIDQLKSVSPYGHDDHSHCVIYGNHVYALLATGAFPYSDDKFCNNACTTDAGLVAKYGAEYCGGMQELVKRGAPSAAYWSVWEIPTALRDPDMGCRGRC